MNEAARRLVTGLRETRSRAIAGNSELAFVLNVDDRIYRIGEAGTGQPLPAAVELELLTAESELAVGGGAIRFYPDGGSTGGEIKVSRNSAVRLVTVDWLTGAVRLAD